MLVSDGVLFTTSAWNVVYAIDARKGTVLWRHDPQVPTDDGKFVCCDVVNRGVALYHDKVYVGTIDGRLVALDRRTGTQVWTAQTTPKDGPYSITGASAGHCAGYGSALPRPGGSAIRTQYCRPSPAIFA